MAMKKPANRCRSRACYFRNNQDSAIGLFRLGFALNRGRGFLATRGAGLGARCLRGRRRKIDGFIPLDRSRGVRHPVADVVRNRTVRHVRIAALARFAPAAFIRTTPTAATTAAAATATAFIAHTAAVTRRLALTASL